MTDAQERAKAARRTALLLIGESGAKVELIIAAALAQVEAETWEKAAKVVEMYKVTPTTVSLDYEMVAMNKYLSGIAEDIRQQAQQAKEGKE